MWKFLCLTNRESKRVTLHKEQIRHDQYRHLTVSEHLKTCNDGKFKIFPIYHCKDPSRQRSQLKGFMNKSLKNNN